MINPNKTSGDGGGNNGSEWDILTEEERREGATVEPIEFPQEGWASLETFDAPMGEGRQDKGVNIVDENGVEKRTSNIMVGKHEIEMDGTHVSIESVQRKASEYLASDKSDEVLGYAKIGPEGKRFASPAELVEDFGVSVLGVGSEIDLSDNPNITNQDARNVEVRGGNGETYKGVFMFGNMGVEMPNGTYVSGRVLTEALTKYVRILPGEVPVVPIVPPNIPEEIIKTGGGEPVPPVPPIEETSEERHEPIPAEEGEKDTEQDKTYRVINRIKEVGNKYVLPIALATATLITAFGGFRNRDTHATTSSADFGVSTSYTETMQEEIPSEQAFEEIMEGTIFSVNTGEKVEVSSGVTYWESSDKGGRHAEFGGEHREVGEYNVDYVSILDKDGRIKNVEYGQGENLGDFLRETAAREGISEDDLTMMVHLGGPVAGWVDVGDIARKKVENLSEEDLMREVVVDKEEQFGGVAENYDGLVTFVDENGQEVRLNLEGAEVGEMVKGTDGREYRVESLEVQTTETGEKKLGWSLADAAKVAALAGGAALLLGLATRKRKKKEMVDMTGKQIEDLVDDSRDRENQTVDEYDAKVKELLEKHEVEDKKGTPEEKVTKALIGQEITVEEVQGLKK